METNPEISYDGDQIDNYDAIDPNDMFEETSG